MATSYNDYNFSGTCVNAILLYKKLVYVSNLGNSKAVVSRLIINLLNYNIYIYI